MLGLMSVRILLKTILFVFAAVLFIVGGSHLGTYIDDYDVGFSLFRDQDNDIPSGSQKEADIESNEILKSSIIGTPTFELVKAGRSHQFWYEVFSIFKNNRFELEEDQKLIRIVPKDQQLKPKSRTKEALLGKAEISKDSMKQLKEKHLNIFKQLPNNIDTSTYKKGSRGVVMVGGGFYSWLSYLSILQIRHTGSNLPVEVVIPTYGDYEKEKDFCETTLAKLNAKCVILPVKLGTAVVRDWSFKSYQFKAVALAISSFQHVLLLDSDNAVVSNIDKLFDSQVYKKNGLILWPDYWSRTVSPLFYDIANVSVVENTRARWHRFPLFSEESLMPEGEQNFHELKGTCSDLSTESGQLLVNKKTHAKMILLSLYYNVFGNEVYYKLFGLGEIGEGDKDTFMTAAVAAGASYYQVKGYIHTFGYLDKKGYHGMAMGQKDPIQDYNTWQKEYSNVQKYLRKNKLHWNITQQEEKLKELEEKYFTGSIKGIDLFSLHCNIGKIDPISYMNNDDLNEGMNRMNHRMYGHYSYKSGEKQVDFEWRRWSDIYNALCVNKIIPFLYGKDKAKDLDGACEYISNTVNWLALTSKTVQTH